MLFRNKIFAVLLIGFIALNLSCNLVNNKTNSTNTEEFKFLEYDIAKLQFIY